MNLPVPANAVPTGAMDLATMVLLGLALAMDAFAVSVACGLRFDRRRHGGALRIAAAFGGFQAAMPIVGWMAGLTLRNLILGFDHWVAFGLLAFLGARMIHEALQAHRRGETIPLPDAARLLVLALATSVDALAVGLTLSLLGAAILLPAAVIGVVTFAVSYLGVVLGYEFEALLQGRAKRDVQILGGIVLIVLGARILLEHLGLT